MNKWKESRYEPNVIVDEKFEHVVATCADVDAVNLIVAAPELLEALENLVISGCRADDSDVELTENQRNVATTDLWESLRNAERAIAKAKGLS
jgi:hypothetical protein